MSDVLIVVGVIVGGFALIVLLGILVGRAIAMRDANPPTIPADQEEQQ